MVKIYNLQIFFVPRRFKEKQRDIVFGNPSFRPPSPPPPPPPPKVVGTLCAQLLLQFYADSFETLHMLLSRYEDMHRGYACGLDILVILRFVLLLFPQVELSHLLGVFTIKMNR